MLVLGCLGCAADAGPATGEGARAAAPAEEVSPEPGPAPLPAGQNLYRPPDELVDGPAGSLVWHQRTASPVPGALAWRVLYRSRSADGDPIVVSGAVFRPAGRAPAGGFPVLSWAVGTVGLADACAPSRSPSFVPRLGRALDAGFVVVAPDGEGLGTRGPAHYLEGLSSAHTILDAARAAADLPGASVSGRVGLWGYSSGGHGVLFAAQEVADYAPELEMLGTVAVAPVVDVTRFASRTGSFAGFTFVTLGGWAKAFGLDPSTIFTDRLIRRLPRLNTECSPTYIFDWPLWRSSDVVVADPSRTAPWRGLMHRQLAGRAPVTGPVLVIQGSVDPIVSAVATEELQGRLCDVGATLDRSTVAGVGHDIAYSTAGQAIDWLAARAAGTAARSDC